MTCDKFRVQTDLLIRPDGSLDVSAIIARAEAVAARWQAHFPPGHPDHSNPLQEFKDALRGVLAIAEGHRGVRAMERLEGRRE